MSGHSKWHKIKHDKGSADAKKSSLFTKLGQAISIVARQGGGDIETNFNLRLAVEKAKQANIPKENIERAIKKGTGETQGDEIEEIIYEAFGPGNSAILIQALTDNKNRTVSSLRRIFNKFGGNLGGQNSVKWMFEQKGVVRIEKKEDLDLEELSLQAIDYGADDIKIEEEGLTIYTKIEDLEKIKNSLENKEIDLVSVGLEWIAKDLIEINQPLQNRIGEIFSELDEDPDVEDYYSNIK